MDKSLSGNDFGNWLRRQLGRRGWSQADFAREMTKASKRTVQNGQVSYWVLGKKTPRPETVDLIADVLGLPIRDVMVAAGHLPEEIDRELGEEKTEIIGMIERVSFEADATRAPMLRGILQTWIDFDRQQKKA